MSEKSWVVWNELDDGVLELACFLESSIEPEVRFVKLERIGFKIKVEEKANFDSLASGDEFFELNAYDCNGRSTSLGCFPSKDLACEGRDKVQMSLYEFLVKGVQRMSLVVASPESNKEKGEVASPVVGTSTDDEVLGRVGNESSVIEVDSNNGRSFRSEPTLSRFEGASEGLQPLSQTRSEEFGQTGSVGSQAEQAVKSEGKDESNKSGFKSAVLAAIVVIAVSLFTLFTANGGMPELSKYIEKFTNYDAAENQDIGAADELDLSEIEDVNQGFFVELVKSEAIEHFQAQGDDLVAIRKKISTLFSTDPLDWATLEDSIVFGDPNAPDLFYIFADPACPACQALEAEIMAYSENPLNYRIVPVSASGNSVDQIDQIMCSDDPRKAWEASLKKEQIESVDTSACTRVGSAIRNREVFDALGLNSTPTVWMPANNRILKNGVPTASELWKQSQAAPL